MTKETHKQGFIYFILQSRLLFPILIFLVLLERFRVLWKFAFVYTDNDQLLLWHAAKDMLNGEYHGLCFYGQKYNPLIEPLLSIPFLWSGMDFSQALPLVTAILSTIPFLALSVFFYKRNDTFLAVLPLLVLLLLSPEFLMLTSIPRGFVTGIFFATFGILLFKYTSSRVYEILSGICFGLAFFANPNSVLLFPLVIPVIFDPKTNVWPKLVNTFIGKLIGLIPFVYNHFYFKARPEMIIHGSPDMGMDTATFVKVCGYLDIYFDFISPVFWRGGWLTLLLFIPVGKLLWKKNRKAEFFTVCILFTGILLSFFVRKVGEGTNSVFFSGARMFLAYPVILIFLLKWFYSELPERKKMMMKSTMLILTLLAVTTKLLHFDMYQAHALRGSKYTLVSVDKVENVKAKCKDIMAFSGEGTELVLSGTGKTDDQLVTYGCPCVENGFPMTLQPLYERRTWMLSGIENKVLRQIFIHGSDTVRKIDLSEVLVLKEDKRQHWKLAENTHKTGLLLTHMNLRAANATP